MGSRAREAYTGGKSNGRKRENGKLAGWGITCVQPRCAERLWPGNPFVLGAGARVRRSTQPFRKNTGKAIFIGSVNTDISLKGQVKGHKLFPVRRGWIEGGGLLFASLRGFINVLGERAPVIEARRGETHRFQGLRAALQPERGGENSQVMDPFIRSEFG